MARDTQDIAAWRSGIQEISDVSSVDLPDLPNINNTSREGGATLKPHGQTSTMPSYGSASSSIPAVGAPIDLTDSPESNKQHRPHPTSYNTFTNYYERQAASTLFPHGNVLKPSRRPPVINQSSSSSSSSLVSLSDRNKPNSDKAVQASAYRLLTVKERTLLQYKSEAAKSGIPLGSPQDPSRYPSAPGQSSKPMNVSPTKTFTDKRAPNPSPQKHNDHIYIPDSPSQPRFVSPEESEKQLKELVETICADMDDVDIDVEIPEGLKCKLLPHQKEGLAWLISREAGKRSGGTRKTGGILADDMGLGKTVQMIALILANKPSRDRPSEDSPRPPKGTLIVAPVAVLNQWKQEIADKTNSLVNLKVYMHHGPQRTKDPVKLAKYDVVLTSYQTLSSELAGEVSENPKKGKKGASVAIDSDGDSGIKNVVNKVRKEAGPLLETKFHRIILDEAHNIKNPSAKMSKACCELQGKFRWCLTGTPIQNGVQDLYALFAFLGSMVKPFNDKSEFRQRIEIPLNRGNSTVAVKRLQVLLSAMMLRRKKDILTLPGIDVVEIKTRFSDPEEQNFYTALSEKVQLQINKFIAGGSIDSQYMAILTLVLRLRQACGHPYLVSKGRDSENVDVDAALAKQNKGKDVEFPRDESVDDLADLMSGVKLAGAQKCRVCFREHLVIYGDGVCDTCRTEIERFAGAQSSTKIRKLLEILSQLRTEDPRQKTIVFSQFTEFLDLIGPALRRAGIRYVDYRGSMKIDERNKSLDDLKSIPAITVILLSFKCGSVGLNLTCCANVVMMDLWWNPALETQAFDRANRFGQTKKVRAYKIMIENTIEDRILELQEKKRQIAKSIVDGEKIKMNKLSTKDLLFLFDRN